MQPNQPRSVNLNQQVNISTHLRTIQQLPQPEANLSPVHPHNQSQCNSNPQSQWYLSPKIPCFLPINTNNTQHQARVATSTSKHHRQPLTYPRQLPLHNLLPQLLQPLHLPR